MPPTRVQIFGQTYSIAGDLDPAYVQKLAAYVDAKMHAIADATTTVDTQKAAVLAALAIADELHSGLRERSGGKVNVVRSVLTFPCMRSTPLGNS